MAQLTILSPGAKVGGKYEVVEVVGFGGMGVVYKVREQVGAVSRIRALKTVLPQYAADKNIAARFREEAEKMCMLEHENIVPVLSYSEEGGFPYIVMPFLEGQTLKEYLANYLAEHHRPLPLSEVMEIGIQLVAGLEVAHRFVNPETHRPQPMIHRDIKPGNIMVRVEERDGERRLRVLIMDFGIAKVVSEEDTGHSLTDVIGTVKYASPEQVRRGRDIDPRADIYSLGMVLYELRVGRHMFADVSEHMILMRMMQREVEEMPIQFPEGVPESFQDLIRRCTAANRDRRYANVGELRAVMRRILEEDSERHLIELEHAREQATRSRAAALAGGAPELAAAVLAEAEGLLGQAGAAESARDLTAGIRLLRAAAAGFERAAGLADDERERRRLAASLAALAPLREAAVRSQAARFAAAEADAAAEATEAAERALHSGELTASARAVARAERAWREAEAKASRALVQAELSEASQSVDAALAAEAATFEAVPERLRREAGIEHLEAARAAASAAHAAAGGEDFDAARARLDEARRALVAAGSARDACLAEVAAELASRLAGQMREVEASGHPELFPSLQREARLAAAEADRARAEGKLVEACSRFDRALALAKRLSEAIADQLAEQRRALEQAEAEAREAEYARLRRQAMAASQDLADLGRTGEPDPESRRLFAALASAEEAAGRGDLSSAVTSLAKLVPELMSRVAGLATERELERAEAQAAGAERRAEAALEAVRQAGGRAVASETFARAGAVLAEGRNHFAAGDFAAASRAYDEAERMLRELAAEIERAERAERLALLEERCGRLAGRLAPIPADRTRKRRRRTVAAALKRAQAALSKGDQAAAASALDEGEGILEELASEPTAVVAAPSESRRLPSAALGGGAAIAVALVAGYLLLARRAPERVSRAPISTPPPAAQVTHAPAPPPVEEVQTAKLPETTAEAPRVEAPQAEAPRAAEAPAAAPTPRVESAPAAPAPVVLASVSPSTRSLTLQSRDEKRFEASVRGTDANGLIWELDRRPVARGRVFLLKKTDTTVPGRRQLELVAESRGSREVLRSWEIDVLHEPLGFAVLEPPHRSLEGLPGSSVRFRAPVKNETELSFQWEVDGKPAVGASGPAYEFQPRDPGQYTVTVKAVAPWGASIDNTWNLTVKPPPPPPTAPRAPQQPPINVEVEIRAWIQAYCSAFESKDVGRLKALGVVRNDEAAERLRQALEMMQGLKMSCSNPSIRVRGDEVAVGFDRMQQWLDPRGAPMQQALPRLEQTLRRKDGHWVAVSP